MSKIDRWKKRNRERKQRPQPIAAPRPDPVYVDTIEAVDNRPTPERRARGIWIEPTGKDADDHMIRDAAVDMIGKLFAMNRITYAQYEAARTFQAIVAAFQQELGVSGYRSCLADHTGGYDGSDGNPEVIAAYRAMQRRIGVTRFLLLRTECDKGPDQKPGNLDVLRKALDAFIGET